MNFDERSVFAAFAPVLQRLSTVQWAGARAATLGARLQKDGAVGRVRPVGEREVTATVSDEASQKVGLRVNRLELTVTCTCGEAPCAHTVAVALETARMARQASASVAQQTDVLAALRDRMSLAKSVPDRDAPTSKMLSDLARLPLDAAVDMVALAWRQSVRHGPHEIQDLLTLTDRLEADAKVDHTRAQAMALRLVQALAARKVVFTVLPEPCEPALQTLCRLALDRPLTPHPDWPLLYDLADAGLPQIGVHLAAGLAAIAHRSLPMAVQLAEAVSGRVLAQRSTWREVATLTPRDRLTDALVVALVQHDDVAGAMELARLWPPMRAGAIALAEKLATEGRLNEILELGEPFDPRGETWQGLMDAAMAVATHLHPEVARQLAQNAWRRAPSLNAFNQVAQFHQGADWPERRHTLATRALVDDDPPWLAERLAQEADGEQALVEIALQWPLRERFQREALLHLEKMAPESAYRIRALRVHSLVLTNAAARTLKDELQRLKECAALFGEPGLARDLAKLLVREQGEKAAWTSAVGAVFGKI